MREITIALKCIIKDCEWIENGVCRIDLDEVESPDYCPYHLEDLY